MGQIELIGRMPYSSNGTFLVQISFENSLMQAIYKPHQGERSLWDFPDGLFLREVAAFELSKSLGWDLIPPTVLRADAPLGIGSIQLFIDANFEEHYFTLFEHVELHPQFMKFALFDIIANNADRKSGHLLIDSNNHVWGIDQGLCFHSEPKLRTVIWEFAGQQIPQPLIDDLASKEAVLTKCLEPFINDDELQAFHRRLVRIIKKPVFPTPDPEMRCYPWPLV